MSFVSYAQNFEDVMLWRALKHVEKGFYIDVGANDPTIDSVTKAFYERGWRGINIEPLRLHYADLLRDRPRDINLQCAVGASNGEIEIWECEVRGWATASANVVAQHTENGHGGIFHKVPITTLTDICRQNVSDEIHFLKVDVEGFEKSVIDGMDFSCFRPWILVVEATKPNSTEEMHTEWEGTVLSADYSLAYCDGVNRYYVAKEHSELLDALRYPPNVLDDFALVEGHYFSRFSETKAQQAETKAQQAETKAQQAETKAQQAETKAQQAETKAQQAETKAQQAENASLYWHGQAQYWHDRILALHASTSWKVTAPLRAIKRLVNDGWGGRQSIARIILKAKQVLQPIVATAIRHVFHRPNLRKNLSQFLKKFPRLHQRLLRVAINTGAIDNGAIVITRKIAPVKNFVEDKSCSGYFNLTLRANEVYTDIEAIIGRKRKMERY